MTPERYARIAEIFTVVSDAEPNARERVIARECSGDSELEREVRQLLAERDGAHDAFADSRLGVAAARAIQDALPGGEVGDVPPVIGQYRVQSLVGEGGMGRVYEALQESPRRRVALKVVRPELESAAVARRFEREADILGALRHPAIAQIIEAGSFEHMGRTRRFFAMEFVEGEPLLKHAQSRDLSISDRLSLLARVADGVEHAHLHGVVHRDLKPSNILVDASGQVKILDFGVARLIAPDEHDEAVANRTTHLTNAGQIVGTIAYMSPEQLSGDSRIDARTDVWSLGVLAHELFTGKTPHDTTGVSLMEAARRVSERDATRLSTIRRDLRGDVETMVAKCLEKDPSRRYPSAGALAADIRRYLDDQPITARRPSSIYQLSKFARRNRGLVAGLSLAGVALLLGTALASWQAMEASKAKRAANKEASDATDARAEAQHEAARAASVAEVLFETFTTPIASRSKGKEITVREALEETANRLETGRFAHPPSPEAEAVVRHALGMVYRDEGRMEDAERECRKSLELRRANLPAGHPQIAAGARALAIVLKVQGRTAEAIPLYREELTILRDRGEPEEVAQCLHNLASALINVKGDGATAAWEEADRLLGESIRMNTQIFGETDHRIAMQYVLQGRLSSRRQLLPEAIVLIEKGVAILRLSQSDANPTLATALNELGRLHLMAKKPAIAEPLLREALAINQRAFEGKADHPAVAVTRDNLIAALEMQGKMEEAAGVRESAGVEKPAVPVK